MNRRNFFTALLVLAPLPSVLRSLGGRRRAEPPPVHEQLDLPLDWLSRPRIPVRSKESPLAACLNNAIASGREVRFRYMAGSSPGEARRVIPALLFRIEGYPHLYLTAHCQKRGCHRTFRIDRCEKLRVI